MEHKPQTSPYMPKWLKAKEQMRLSILNGELGPEGAPFPPVRSIALRCGISLVTAQKIVTLLKDDGLISQQGKGHVIKAKGAGKGLPRRIGLIVSIPDNPFFAMLTRNIEAAASRRGIGTVTAYSAYDAAKERELLEMFAADGVSGILACPADEKLSGRNFSACPLPHVLIGRKLEGYEADTVLVQNFSAGQAIARHLVANGANSFAYLGLGNFLCDPRLQGFKSGLSEMGKSLPETSIVHADNMALDAVIPSLRNLLKRLPKPIALFCFHDLLAARALRAAANLGISIPDELAVVGFDNLPIAAELTPSLSSVAYPLEQMAELALESLLRRIGGGTGTPRVSYLEPSLVIRESSGGASSSNSSLNTESLAYSLA